MCNSEKLAFPEGGARRELNYKIRRVEIISSAKSDDLMFTVQCSVYIFCLIKVS